MAHNFVGVFKGKDDKMPWKAEIRSLALGSFSRPNKFAINMKKKGSSYVIECEIKYVAKKIPLAMLFRALGFI